MGTASFRLYGICAAFFIGVVINKIFDARKIFFGRTGRIIFCFFSECRRFSADDTFNPDDIRFFFKVSEQ